MSWNLKEHGDIVERNAYPFIQSCIPLYEEIWKRLIGHRGDGVIATANGLTPEADIIRKKFSEHHYTVLHALFIMDMIVKEEESEFMLVGFKAYIKKMKNIEAFWSTAGKAKDNLRECFYLMGYPKSAGDPTDSLKIAYEERSIYLHEKRPPIFIDSDGMYLIAELASQDNPDGWSNKLTWEQAKGLKKEYICDSLTKRAAKIYTGTNALLGKLLEYVKEFIEDNKVTLTTPAQQPHMNLVASNTSYSPPASGMTYIPSYTAVSGSGGH